MVSGSIRRGPNADAQLHDVARHAAQQRLIDQDQASASLVHEMNENSKIFMNDPGAIQFNRQIVEDETAFRHRHKPPGVIVKLQREAVSDLHVGVIHAALDSDDPQRAADYFAHYRGEVDDSQHDAIHRGGKLGMARVNGQRAVSRIM